MLMQPLSIPRRALTSLLLLCSLPLLATCHPPLPGHCVQAKRLAACSAG